MEYITVGRMNNGYINVSLDDFTVFVGLNNGLNEKKYKELKKKSKIVYTVIGIVSQSLRFKSLMGYIISDDKGKIKLVTEDKLLTLLKKHSFLNYSYTLTDDGRCFARKSPKVVIKEFEDDDVKERLGYSFHDFSLSLEMTLEEIEFCMENNDFRLGFRRDFPVEYFGTTVVGSHLVYYNKEGTQIILNTVNRKDKPLNYYHQTCMLMRNIDHKKYHTYLRDNPYNTCSSSPLVDVRDPNLDPNHTDMVFTSTTIYRFLNMSDKAKTYSKPVIPYSLGHNMYALHSILNITPYQEKKIAEYLQGDKNWKTSNFMRLYMGYLNMLKYSDGLKKFYSECIVAFPLYKEELVSELGLSSRKIKDMQKYVENLA